MEYSMSALETGIVLLLYVVWVASSYSDGCGIMLLSAIGVQLAAARSALL